MKFYCVIEDGKVFAISSSEEEAKKIKTDMEKAFSHRKSYTMELLSDAKGIKPLFKIVLAKANVKMISCEPFGKAYTTGEKIQTSYSSPEYTCFVRAENAEKAIQLAKKRVKAEYFAN